MARPSVSMPEPISPKTPTISPARTAKLDVVELAGHGQSVDRQHLLRRSSPLACDVVEVAGDAAEHRGEHLAARG